MHFSRHLRHGRTGETPLRRGLVPNLASRLDFWPVETAEGQSAVIRNFVSKLNAPAM
jgi:hypothetical protein